MAPAQQCHCSTTGGALTDVLPLSGCTEREGLGRFLSLLRGAGNISSVCTPNEQGLFSQVTSARTRGNGLRLHQEGSGQTVEEMSSLEGLSSSGAGYPRK